jgi:AraC family transcriptional regulator of adaptative response / DNA-3-methyladenine glycosylase II
LIADGALDGDEANVDRLAARLGIGDRQLRRLFMQHLGASPIAAAQTRRVLFAKQLIHETRMSMVDVALAAGFGSVRRFNETFRRLYGRAPSALRRERSAPGPAESSGITLVLSYAPPYDWQAMIDFLAARAIPGVESVEPDRYRRTIALGAHHGTVEVRPASGRPALVATIRFPNMKDLPAIVTRIRRVFDLAADTATIAGQLRRDPDLAPLVERRPGLRVPGAWDGFELAVRAILGQQITVAGARRLAGKLVAAYGDPLASEGIDTSGPLAMVFPSADRLADRDLSSLGLPRARAGALSTLAAMVAADQKLFQPDQDLGAAVERLKALPGIGEWTAQYIAMRVLREPDAFPADDIGLLRAMAPAYGARPRPPMLLARAESWRPWRAYAAQHLWTAGAVAMRTFVSEREEAVA